MIEFVKKQIDYKVPNGKLLRIDLELNNGVINFIKITGDFFMYPEESIYLIEKKITGIKVIEVNKVLSDFIKKNKIKIVGFTVQDLVDALK